jgi:hypothetical protein
VYLAVIGGLLVATFCRAYSDAQVEDVDALRELLRLAHRDLSNPVSFRDPDLQDAVNQEETYNELTEEPSEKLTGHWVGTRPQTNVVAELIQDDNRRIENALRRNRNRAILDPVPALIVTSLAILLIIDLIQIITGTFRDGDGARLSKWA